MWAFCKFEALCVWNHLFAIADRIIEESPQLTFASKKNTKSQLLSEGCPNVNHVWDTYISYKGKYKKAVKESKWNNKDAHVEKLVNAFYIDSDAQF